MNWSLDSELNDEREIKIQHHKHLTIEISHSIVQTISGKNNCCSLFILLLIAYVIAIIIDCMFLSCHAHISEWIHTPVWLNDCMFVYKLSGSGFESSCSRYYHCLFKYQMAKNIQCLFFLQYTLGVFSIHHN